MIYTEGVTINLFLLFGGLILLAFETNVLAFNVDHNRGRYVCRWCKQHYDQPQEKKTGKGKQTVLVCPRCHKCL